MQEKLNINNGVGHTVYITNNMKTTSDKKCQEHYVRLSAIQFITI